MKRWELSSVLDSESTQSLYGSEAGLSQSLSLSRHPLLSDSRIPPHWTLKLSALMPGLCFRSDLYVLFGQSLSKLSSNIFCIDF